MRVFDLSQAVEDYGQLLHVDPEDRDRFLHPLDSFDGTPRAGRWFTPTMYWQTEGGRLPPGDFCELPGGPLVFSPRALEALGDLLEGRGELLPIRVVDAEDGYRIFNTTRLSDVLDERETVFKRFQSSGRVRGIERAAINEAKLDGETIFKLPQVPRRYTLVTEPFVAAVDRAGLTGFEFRPMWP